METRLVGRTSMTMYYVLRSTYLSCVFSRTTSTVKGSRLWHSISGWLVGWLGRCSMISRIVRLGWSGLVTILPAGSGMCSLFQTKPNSIWLMKIFNLLGTQGVTGCWLKWLKWLKWLMFMPSWRVYESRIWLGDHSLFRWSSYVARSTSIIWAEPLVCDQTSTAEKFIQVCYTTSNYKNAYNYWINPDCLNSYQDNTEDNKDKKIIMTKAIRGDTPDCCLRCSHRFFSGSNSYSQSECVK